MGFLRELKNQRNILGTRYTETVKKNPVKIQRVNCVLGYSKI